MKNLVPLILAFTFIGFYPVKKVSAQAYLFNKIFKPDTLNIGSPAIIATDNGYLIAQTYAAPNNFKSFGIRKANQYGETEWFKHLDLGQEEHLMIGGGVLSSTQDGHYMLVGSKGAEPLVNGGNRDILMIKFDAEGNVFWKKTNGEPDRIENAYHITPTQDGGYIMCGIQRSFTSSNRFYVLKTDALGNKEWDRVYNPLQHGSAFSIFETNSGFIVSGYMFNAASNYDMVIVKIDKYGDVIWQKFYGSNGSDTGCAISPDIEGNSILAIASINDNNIKKPYIFSIDTLGNILWQNIYEIETLAPQEAPILRTENGGFICMYAFKNQLNKNDTRIFSFTSTGDTLWTRTIPGLNPADNWYLKDIASTPDGGFILSGFNYSQQSSWVVKTDSLGRTCSYIGCDSTVVVEVIMPGIPFHSNSEVSAMVYPVPASTQLNISYQIPATILPSGGALWRLYDALGRQVAKEALHGGTGVAEVSVAHLPAGIYYYRVLLPTSGQAVARGKVVVS